MTASGVAIGPAQAQAPSHAITARDLLAELPVEPEKTGGYSRELFKHWIDADRDGCNTRMEVLKSESRIPVEIAQGCKVVAGEWYSWYDNVTVTDPSRLDIDHLIPLAEAWRSGADQWTAQQREEFANDLEFERSLEAVTASSNRSKGDRDPAKWLPSHTPAHCDYATAWIAVKYRWRLTTDPAEFLELSNLMSNGCGDVVVTPPVRAIPASDDNEPGSGGPGPELPTPLPARTFVDVKTSNTFHDAITWLGGTGISNGYDRPDGRFDFRPSSRITREAMAAFMYRFADSQDNPAAANYTPPTKSPFADVPTHHKFYKEIAWLASTKITTGYSDGTFRPQTQISREAMAAFMYRYATLSGSLGSPVAPASMLFDDMPPVHTFYKEVTWMGTQGISTGYDSSITCQVYRPLSKVSREAMAAFMFRFANGGTEGLTQGCITPPPNPGDVKNCGDFQTWGQANNWFQKYFRYFGDVARLDADGDGVPCQGLKGAPRT